MNIIDALLGEHAVLYSLFDQLEENAETATALEGLLRAAEPVVSALLAHARLEEELVFPALRQQLGPDGLIAIMSDEHQEIDSLLQAALRTDNLDDASADLIHALNLAREHFEKEEQVLFLDARDALAPTLCEDLGTQWAKLRGVSLTA